MREDGTNASTIHFPFRAQLGGGSVAAGRAGSLAAGLPLCLPRVDGGGTPIGFAAACPQKKTITASKPNPTANNHACPTMLRFGSMKSGKPRKENMLPN